MSSTHSLSLDYKMNEQKVKELLKKLRYYIEQLEFEVMSRPEAYVNYDYKLHEELRKYEQWDDDDGYPDWTMALGKKTIKLVNKLLHDPEKRKLYTDAELAYMEKQVVNLKKERKRRVRQRQQEKGFSWQIYLYEVL